MTPDKIAETFLKYFCEKYDKKRRLIFEQLCDVPAFIYAKSELHGKHVRIVSGYDIIKDIKLIRFDMMVKYQRRFYHWKIDFEGEVDYERIKSAAYSAAYCWNNFHRNKVVEVR